MRKILSTVALGLVLLTGCAHNVVTAPLPTTAVDTIDADAYKVLSPAHAAAMRLSSDVSNGLIHPTDTQKQALVALNKALNVADAALIAYHNAGGGNASVLNASTTAVSTALTTVINSFYAGAK